MEVTELDDIDDLHRAARLLADIWSTGPGETPVMPELLKALADFGGYVAGAVDVDDGELLGVSAGFVGLVDGRIELHSHITGVRPDAQGTGVGYALKQHQRDWARARGIGVITWTFDPLVRRNGWFNLMKLGAVITGYRERYYGEMVDAINAGDETDRCVIEWTVDGEAAAPRGDAIAGDTVLCATPDDIVALRHTDPDTARAWRVSVREAMSGALAAGYVGVAMTDEGAYVLSRPPAGTGPSAPSRPAAPEERR